MKNLQGAFLGKLPAFMKDVPQNHQDVEVSYSANPISGQVGGLMIQSSFKVSHNEKLCPFHRSFIARVADAPSTLTQFQLHFEYPNRL